MRASARLVLCASIVFAAGSLGSPLRAQDTPTGEAGADAPPMVSPHPGADAPPMVSPHPGGAPPMVSPHPGGAPHPGGGGAAGHPDLRALFDPPPIATATPSDSLPAGTIRVLVSDASGVPVSGADVQLGVMAQGDRSRVGATTDAEGVAVFRDLASGTSQAYRVNVPFEGATFSSTPFQLPTDQGYDVRIRRLPVTHDARSLFLVIGQTVVEIRNERLHITQHVQLGNPSMSAYVFPDAGLTIRLPEGFLAFQAQAVMTDQRVEEVADRGLRIRGSMPPGTVTLAWAYDVPIIAEDMDIDVQVPLPAIRYRVIADGAPGMRVDVDGMPTLTAFDDEGRPMLGTELVRRPGDAPLDLIHIHLRGIPGPGPARAIALVIAALFAFGGILGVSIGPKRNAADLAVAARARRRQELLDEAASLEKDLEAGEIGPAYRQSRRTAIVDELAALLRADERAATSSGAKSATSAKKPAPRASAEA